MEKVKKGVIILVHAFVGWALCGATMGIGMSVTSLSNTLVIHAIAAPYHLQFSFVALFQKIPLYCPFANSDNHGLLFGLSTNIV